MSIGSYIFPFPPITRGHQLKFTRTKLQAVLALSIAEVTPTVSLSRSDSEEPLKIFINARIQWATHPSKPLTIAAWRNLFSTPNERLRYAGGSIAAFVCMRSRTNPDKTLQLGHVGGAVRVHWKYPVEDNWRDVMAFVTIPSQESGESFNVTHVLERHWLLEGGKVAPLPGEEFIISLDKKCFIAWWNWGGLEQELKGKKLVQIPSPEISRSREPEEDEVMSYGCWEWEDDEGNEMIFLDVVIEGEPALVKFEE